MSPRLTWALLAVSAILAGGGAGALIVAGSGGGGEKTESTTAAPSPSSGDLSQQKQERFTVTAEKTVTETQTPPEPAGPLPLAEAVATVDSEGYQVLDTSTYGEDADIAALIGLRKGSATSYAQRAFFFAKGEYLGNDTSDDSASITLAYQEPGLIALEYTLYASEDPNCCPTMGSATVRYSWDGSTLTPLDPIPPVGNVDGSRR